MAHLGIAGGAPVRSTPFAKWPVADEEDAQAVAEVVRSGAWGRMTGTCVRTFEQRFAEYQGGRHGLAVANGTVALEVALKALDVGPGDEVLVPPYTFMATATTVLQVGAIPVFVDIDPETYNLDHAEAAADVTPRTRAIVPVHFGGLPCDMAAVLAVAQAHGLAVLEDAAHGHGGRWRDRGLGAIGQVGAFSFQASKNLTAGEGGFILTDSEELWARCVLYHDFWRGALRPESDPDNLGGWRTRFPVLSWNYRLSELQGALLLSQLRRLEQQAARREDNAVYLESELARTGVLAPRRRDAFVTRDARHIFIARYRPESAGGLPHDRFVEALRAEGIPATAGYLAPVYRHPVFLNAPDSLVHGFPVRGSGVDFRAVRCPVAERVCAGEAVWLPQALLLGTRADMDDVVAAVAKVRTYAAEAMPA